MIVVKFLIPVTDNSGAAFEADHFAAFESAILDRFGGFSVDPSEVEGAWRSDAGVTYRDRSRCYLVAVDSIARGAAVAELAAVAKAHFAQEAIAILYLGQLEIL